MVVKTKDMLNRRRTFSVVRKQVLRGRALVIVAFGATATKGMDGPGASDYLPAVW